MQQTYAEMQSGGDFAHLAQTVDQYLSLETPLWWVEPVSERSPQPALARAMPIACLWLGTAIDQVVGDAHAHVFLLYVAPAHRRRGIGTALMRHAEDWAIARGDRQIGLQVFESNQAALRLYQSLGFEARSMWMVKSLK
jgi:ribosomal protein S18 acetylase RimI-like enzyme